MEDESKKEIIQVEKTKVIRTKDPDFLSNSNMHAGPHKS